MVLERTGLIRRTSAAEYGLRGCRKKVSEVGGWNGVCEGELGKLNQDDVEESTGEGRGGTANSHHHGRRTGEDGAGRGGQRPIVTEPKGPWPGNR